MSGPGAYDGCSLNVERANAVASLDRAVRRCRRCFAAGEERALADRVASALGVGQAADPAPHVDDRPPRQRRRPRAGEIEAWRQIQADAARAIDQRYLELRIDVEQLEQATEVLESFGAYPCHMLVDPRSWALVELDKRHGTLVPQAQTQEWFDAHTRWIQPLLDGRADARDRELRAHIDEEPAP